MKAVTTWILLADGARARILRNIGPNKGIEPVEGMIFCADHRPTREIDADKPGRTFQSVGQLRHAKQPRSDPHENLKDDFNRALAQTLERCGSDYDRLILVAPAPALGRLRSHITASVASKVRAELVMNLTHIPDNELADHLQDVIVL